MRNNFFSFEDNDDDDDDELLVQKVINRTVAQRSSIDPAELEKTRIRLKDEIEDAIEESKTVQSDGPVEDSDESENGNDLSEVGGGEESDLTNEESEESTDEEAETTSDDEKSDESESESEEGQDKKTEETEEEPEPEPESEEEPEEKETSNEGFFEPLTEFYQEYNQTVKENRHTLLAFEELKHIPSIRDRVIQVLKRIRDQGLAESISQITKVNDNAVNLIKEVNEILSVCSARIQKGEMSFRVPSAGSDEYTRLSQEKSLLSSFSKGDELVPSFAVESSISVINNMHDVVVGKTLKGFFKEDESGYLSSLIKNACTPSAVLFTVKQGTDVETLDDLRGKLSYTHVVMNENAGEKKTPKIPSSMETSEIANFVESAIRYLEVVAKTMTKTLVAIKAQTMSNIHFINKVLEDIAEAPHSLEEQIVQALNDSQKQVVYTGLCEMTLRHSLVVLSNIKQFCNEFLIPTD